MTSAIDPFRRAARLGDIVLLCSLGLLTALSVGAGMHYGGVGLAAGAGLGLLAAGALAFQLMPATMASRCTLALACAAEVALQIDVARGAIEMHFGVFVLLSLVMVYRDWRVIALVAGFFAVHHIGFQQLQAAGFGVWCTPEPDLPRVLLHAGYVVVQSAAGVAIVSAMQQSGRVGEELVRLLDATRDGERLRLDTSGVQVDSPAARRLQNSLAEIHRLVTSLQGNSQGVATASSEIASGNRDLSARTERTACGLQETSESIARITRGVTEAAAVSADSSRLIADASQAASRGGQAIAQVVEAMGAIQQSSQRIGDIIGTIDGIAFQTNLLALNAAVEAARAGEQGRGFAVVAGEVRTLAQRSAEAARDVKALVGSSLAAAGRGTTMVDQAGRTMDEVLHHVREASERASRLSEITAGQARDAGEVAQSVCALDEITQQNTTLVQQTASASSALQDQAEALSRTLRSFEA